QVRRHGGSISVREGDVYSDLGTDRPGSIACGQDIGGGSRRRNYDGCATNRPHTWTDRERGNWIAGNRPTQGGRPAIGDGLGGCRKRCNHGQSLGERAWRPKLLRTVVQYQHPIFVIRRREIDAPGSGKIPEISAGAVSRV